MRLTAPLLLAIAACATDGDLGDEDPGPGVSYGAGSHTSGDPDWRWPDDEVRYWISSSVSDPTLVETTLEALESGFPLTFTKETSKSACEAQPGCLEFIPDTTGSASWTNNGTPANGSTINLKSSFSARTVRHELGHALGLIHEHCRSDRDSYVWFRCNCYQPGCVNGIPNPTSPTNGLNPYKIRTEAINFTPYQIDSIMHYDSTGAWDTTCHALVELDGSDLPPTSGTDDWTYEDRNTLWQMYEPELGIIEPGDDFGQAMVAADFDGDGYEDLAVGAPGETPGSEWYASGAVLLYKGTWANGLVPWKVLRESDFTSATHDDDRFGAALAARDMNGDDMAELFVGAPGYQTSSGTAAGAVFYYRGAEKEGLVPEQDYITQGGDTNGVQANENLDEFGAALAILSSGPDGNAYLAVGAPGEVYNGVSSGYVSIFRWTNDDHAYWNGFNNAGLSGGAMNGDEFGFSLKGADFSGDDVTELAIGAPYAGSTDIGKVYVMRFGAAQMEEVEVLPNGTLDANDHFGWDLAAGDIDHDGNGQKELAVGAPDRFGGRVYVYTNSLAPGDDVTFVSSVTLGASTTDGDDFGRSLAMGDSNGDGYRDLAVGLPLRDSAGTNAGQVRVFLGDDQGGLTSDPASPIDGSAGDKAGTSVVFANVDNANKETLVIGLPGRGSGAGAISVRKKGTLTLRRLIDQATNEWR